MTIIEVKPRKWGWCVFESPGVEPVFLEKDQAIGYAETRDFVQERYAFSIQPATLNS
jgi:hypothetical protein